ncbi:glycosyltransferase family 4 protein [Aggregatibacter actinomycetemcomitans]|nr:glycosyltransferase family 4 protein [Aggregatibacter actinomycetemcomitans]
MRVAYICADPGIPVFGTKGASVHVQEVIKGMLQRGLEVVLFAQRLGGEVPQELSQITIHKLPSLPNDSQQERAAAALAANAEVEKLLESAGDFDLIYERYSLWSKAGMAFARKHRCVGILEVNAPLIEEQKKHRELPLEAQSQEVAEFVFSHADAMIAVSPGVKDYLETFPLAKGRVHVIANGVDLARFAPVAAQNAAKLKQPEPRNETPVLGFLGTLKPWHGVSGLVQAWALLHKQGYRVKLLIVGDGPQHATLTEEIAQLGLSDFVHFTGAVAPEQVPEWLARMDIATAPYPNQEGFYFSPLKIYEYMAAGLPIIATLVGHLSSVIENGYNGILVEADNPQKMAESIARLLDNPSQAQQLGANARLTAEQKHSWLAVVDRILHITRDCRQKLPT